MLLALHTCVCPQAARRSFDVPSVNQGPGLHTFILFFTKGDNQSKALLGDSESICPKRLQIQDRGSRSRLGSDPGTTAETLASGVHCFCVRD